MELRYWNIMGLCQPIRNMLAASGEPFTNKEYTWETRDSWFGADKPAIKQEINFANLPYFTDGQVKLTQSTAIYRYLGEKFGWMPADAQGRAQADMLFGEWNDIWTKFYWLNRSSKEDYAKNKAAVKDEILAGIANMAAYLKAGDKKFMLGDQLTWVDFYAQYLVCFLRTWSKEINAVEGLAEYHDRVLEKAHERTGKYKALYEGYMNNTNCFLEGFMVWGGKPPAQLAEMEFDV